MFGFLATAFLSGCSSCFVGAAPRFTGEHWYPVSCSSAPQPCVPSRAAWQSCMSAVQCSALLCARLLWRHTSTASPARRLTQQWLCTQMWIPCTLSLSSLNAASCSPQPAVSLAAICVGCHCWLRFWSLLGLAVSPQAVFCKAANPYLTPPCEVHPLLPSHGGRMTITEAQLCHELEHEYSSHRSKNIQKHLTVCLSPITQTLSPWLPESLVEHSN